MERKINPSVEVPMLLLNLVPLLVTLFLWNRIPEQVPVHWNINGQADGYGPKWLLPFFNLGLYLLLLFCMFIDPRKENYLRFRKIFNGIRWVLSAFFVVISCITVMVAMGYDIGMDRVMLISIPLLFALMGNYMLNLKPNWFMGIRTPWTLSSEHVWRQTHRLAGRLWFWSGLACCISGFFASTRTGMVVLVCIVGLMTLVPIAYGWLLYRKEKHDNTAL